MKNKLYEYIIHYVKLSFELRLRLCYTQNM